MDEQEKLAEKISDFLSGEMPEEEKLSFEAQIAADPEIANEVQVYANLLDAIEEVGQEDLKTRLRARLDEKLENAPRVIPFYQRPYALFAAACLAIVCIASIWLILRPVNQVKGNQYASKIMYLSIEGLDNQESGFAGSSEPDSLVLQIKANSSFKEEYIFHDSLILFVKELGAWDQASITYVPEKKIFNLYNNGNTYVLLRGFSSPRELKAN